MPFKSKKTRFYQYEFVIGGRRFRGSCGTEDLAEAKLIEAQHKIDAAKETVRPDRFTVSQAFGTYWSDICEQQPSSHVTMSSSRMILTVIDGSKGTDELTPADIQSFVNQRRKSGVSVATINRQLDVLMRALQHMKTRHGAVISEIPFRKFRLKEPQERVRELTYEEQDSLFRELRWDLHPFALFALMTGARRSTIANLRWRDVDFRHARMNLLGKFGKRYRFPISPEIGDLLRAVPRSDDPEASRFVFLYRKRSRRGMPLTPIRATPGGGLMEDFRETLDRAGIEDFRFHDLRHTFATRLLRKTGNLKMVSRLLGHASIEVTMRYAHVLDEDMSTAMADFSIMPQTSPQTISETAAK